MSIIFFLRTLIPIDKMMIGFMGQSFEATRIKNKPIVEGFHFFVLALKIGFVVNLTPDGKTARNQDDNEYVQQNSQGNIEAMLLFVTSAIITLKDKQRACVNKHKKQMETWRTLAPNTSLYQMQLKSFMTLALALLGLPKTKGVAS